MLNHNNKIICNDDELVKIFNEHCINTFEKLVGEKSINITKEYSFDNDKQAVDFICKSYKNHPRILNSSIITAKENTNDNTILLFVNSNEQCLQKLNPSKAFN